jgi:hypothetical protein
VPKGEDLTAAHLFLSTRSGRISHAVATWTLKSLGDGRVDFSFEIENDNPEFKVLDSQQRRVHLRETIQETILKPLTVSLLTGIHEPSPDVDADLLDAFFEGYIGSVRQMEEPLSPGFYLQGEQISASH